MRRAEFAMGETRCVERADTDVRTGLARSRSVQGNGKPPAFCALQDRNSAESFSRSVQGRAACRRACDQGQYACVLRVAMEGHPGLERSTECVAQWSPWACMKHGQRSAMGLRRPAQ